MRAMPGRTTPKRTTHSSDDQLPSLRERSPWAFWMAVLVLVGLVASILAGVFVGIV